MILSWSAVALWSQTAPVSHVVKIRGNSHQLALFSDGSVGGWGAMDSGQLGPVSAIPATGRQSLKMVPIRLPGKAADIAASGYTSYALLEDGTVVAWGRGDVGQLGIGGAGTKGSETPVRVSGLANVTQIAASGGMALALLKDGTVRAWGSRQSGMLGDGLDPKRYLETGPPALSPVPVPNVSNITQISAGGGHVLALTASGHVIAWGSNYNGALGRPPRRELPMDEAAEVPGLTGVVSVAAGNVLSTVLKKDGTVWAWGSNEAGQFGNGQRSDSVGVNSGWELIPQQVPGVSNVIAISLGGRHTLALLKDGTLRGWGNTDWGQLGGGVSGAFQEKPMTPKITGVKAVFGVGNNSYAIRTDDTLWAWGSGGRDEPLLPTNTKLPVKLDLK